MHQKTSRPVQFKITEQTRNSVAQWIDHEHLGSDSYFSQVAFMILRISPPDNMPE